MITVLFLRHLPGNVDLDYGVSLPPIHLVVPSLYLLLWIAFSASLQVNLINSFFVYVAMLA